MDRIGTIALIVVLLIFIGAGLTLGWPPEAPILAGMGVAFLLFNVIE